MYYVKWQIRGLPHARIMIRLIEKIKSNDLDKIVSAEIPDVPLDCDFHEIFIKNMIHAPFGTFNTNLPCMVNGKCSKRYPQELVAEKITGNDDNRHFQ